MQQPSATGSPDSQILTQFISLAQWLSEMKAWRVQASFLLRGLEEEEIFHMLCAATSRAIVVLVAARRLGSRVAYLTA